MQYSEALMLFQQNNELGFEEEGTFSYSFTPMERDVSVHVIPKGRHNPTTGEIIRGVLVGPPTEESSSVSLYGIAEIQISKLKGEF